MVKVGWRKGKVLESEEVNMFLVCATEERSCIGSKFEVDPGRVACVAYGVARNLIE